MSPRKEHPTRDEIALLPPFPGLTLERIHLLRGEADLAAAEAEILRERQIGFDTESKPTFTREAVSDGPHLIQIALSERAFIIQIDARPPLDFLKRVIESEEILKIGFGLDSDRGPLLRKLGLQLRGSIELSRLLRQQLGYRQDLGVKAAVAAVLGQRLSKSRKATTSNWAAATLSPSQLTYAANDAFAALQVFRALGSEAPHSPQQHS
ncbi:3'-5' exonuclease domain-containing protein 2 [Paucibacter sp. O1-1]|nr:3'-5' exonuclease domain-containing protein 2 [Paucibacter sp. O1-1]MDA3826796.1 3'-5' exonuclease domain-containing protein 2 [Paucibacter sp. O1-1]